MILADQKHDLHHTPKLPMNVLVVLFGAPVLYAFYFWWALRKRSADSYAKYVERIRDAAVD